MILYIFFGLLCFGALCCLGDCAKNHPREREDISATGDVVVLIIQLAFVALVAFEIWGGK